MVCTTDTETHLTRCEAGEPVRQGSGPQVLRLGHQVRGRSPTRPPRPKVRCPGSGACRAEQSALCVRLWSVRNFLELRRSISDHRGEYSSRRPANGGRFHDQVCEALAVVACDQGSPSGCLWSGRGKRAEVKGEGDLSHMEKEAAVLTQAVKQEERKCAGASQLQQHPKPLTVDLAARLGCVLASARFAVVCREFW